MGIFDANGGFVQGLGKMIDTIFLSILFLISCLPIFTIGTATTALYYTVNKVIKNDRGHVFREYVSAFKNNFKQTTPVWFLVMLLFGILGIDIYILHVFGQNGSQLGNLTIFFLVMGVVFFVWVLYLFAYMARFENTRKESMKNAAIIAVTNLPWSALLFIMTVVAALLMYGWTISIIFMPGVFTIMENCILEKIFWKYMSEEDRAAELERNREFKN